jgi:hydrogenase maturation protein HypF
LSEVVMPRRLVVQGIVQGVGCRPQVWRLAQQFGVVGTVRNQGTTVVIEAYAPTSVLMGFETALRAMSRGGLRVDVVHASALPMPQVMPTGFEIASSVDETPGLGVSPDWATCPACVAEVADPVSRRYRYALTACSECGPRLSVFQRVPYDRANTTMAAFPLCPACLLEYTNREDRRFHAQAMACPVCGPTVALKRLDGHPVAPEVLGSTDDVEAAARLIAQGEILLIKGLGGYQLACDATLAQAINRLRSLKQRQAKPFALLVKDIDMARQWCEVEPAAEHALRSAAAPIVLMPRRMVRPFDLPELAEGIAPGLRLIGVMLPPTALHHLLMRDRCTPLVLTSGNVSGEPQAITLEDAVRHAHAHVTHVLDHDRAVERRVDDSVGRVIAGEFRMMRRARGYAPAPLQVPEGFDTQTQVLALGGDLKNTFALLRDGQGVLSQHMGDLHDVICLTDQQQALAEYLRFYEFEPQLMACDAHPGYLATQMASQGQVSGVPPVMVQHHHAHIASCLGEHGWPLHGGPVLGIALDGIGMGERGQLLGGEFLLADYQACQRVGTFKPVALLGGDAAAREPWRNTYAHLMAALGWEGFEATCASTELLAYLANKPRAVLDQMLAKPGLAPRASSVGRLFDAVAGAMGICRDRVAYEGEAAMRLEAMVTPEDMTEGSELNYPFAIDRLGDGQGLPCVEPLPMWQALLNDLSRGTPLARMAARFHRGLAQAVVRMATQLAAEHGVRTVALGGGVFQNRCLTEEVMAGLSQAGLEVLMPRQVPSNDGGLAWGQALIALARSSPVQGRITMSSKAT